MEKLFSLAYNINSAEDIPYEGYCKSYLYLLPEKLLVLYKILWILLMVAVWTVLIVLYQRFFAPFLPLNNPFVLLYWSIGVVIISVFLWKDVIQQTLKGSYRRYKEECFFQTGKSIELNLYDDNLETICVSCNKRNRKPYFFRSYKE